VTVKTQILLYYSCSLVPTLLLYTQLTSMWSITHNIQHLAPQQSQHKTQGSMLWTRGFFHFPQADTVNCLTAPHDDVLKPVKARAAWEQIAAEPGEHGARYDPKCSLWRREAYKCSVQAILRKRHGSRMIWIERLQWQAGGLKCRNSK